MGTGKSLREWRRSEGLSAKALADLLGIGVNRIYKLQKIPRLLTAEEREALIALGAPVETSGPPRVRKRSVRPGRPPDKPSQAAHKPGTPAPAPSDGTTARVGVHTADDEIAAIFAPLIQEARERFEQIERERQIRAERMLGSPRDAAVQQLALMQLVQMREERHLTYEEIAKVLGVSGERVRTLRIQLSSRHAAIASSDHEGRTRPYLP